MKQNKKRFFCLLALAALLLCALTACSSTPRTAQAENAPVPVPTALSGGDTPDNVSVNAPEERNSALNASGDAADKSAQPEKTTTDDTTSSLINTPASPSGSSDAQAEAVELEIDGRAVAPLNSPDYVPAPATGMPAQEAPATIEPQAAPSTAASQSSSASAKSSTSSQSASSSKSSAPTALTRGEAIAAGHVVLSGKRSMPCHNADVLDAFFADYRAGREGSVSIYSYRTQNDGERHYTLHTLTALADGTTRMTEDTTFYHDPARDGSSAPEAAGVRTLGTFVMTKNRYGFIAVDVNSMDGKLQYHYQVTGYDKLYPSTVQYAEEAALYLQPLVGTGILEFEWNEPAILLTMGVFPQGFEQIAGREAVGDRSRYWNEAKKTYCYPGDLVEKTLQSHFSLSAEQVRELSAYDADSKSYNYVPRSNGGLADIRILAVTEPEGADTEGLPELASGESYTQVRYEFFNAEDGSPISRGKLMLIVRDDDTFRYVANEMLPPPENAE